MDWLGRLPLFVLMIGFAADIAQRVVDPRLRTTLSGTAS